ncbi:MAG: lysine--tRNA ligase [Nitrososphaerota archaeon]|nr:lysine--tRNA ligase [Nitrososphaerota archaeon]
MSQKPDEDLEGQEVIGKGTWLDTVANELVEREKKIGRSLSRIRVESGLGASGFPHIGSLGDAARAYGIKLALENMGYKSELIAYSDDMDALRKVPAGLPDWLESEIGRPVSEINDPFGCHDSYGAHMSSLLLDSLDKMGMEYNFQSGYKAYKAGILVSQIQLVLSNAEKIGKMIEELTGQRKYLESLPYFPQCEKCGRLNVARPYRFDPTELRVYYRCTGDEIGRKWVDGCGHEGAADIRKGEGKLSWKVEFAARWAAFDVRFEAHGKELTDSVKINDWISDNVLAFPHPSHVVYELFQDKGGRKISKSVGNLITPQQWLAFATPQSLMHIYFKRIAGARNISEEDIPGYMDEYDQLEDLYFGKIKEENKFKEAKLKGVYYYSNLAKPPFAPSQHVPYRLLVELASVAPEQGPVDYISKRLVDYRVVKQLDGQVTNRINLALNWAKEFSLVETEIKITEKQKQAVLMVCSKISTTADPQQVQAVIFESARSNGLEPSDLFRSIYLLLLGVERGPRLGPYIIDIGVERVAEKLRHAVTEGN